MPPKRSKSKNKRTSTKYEKKEYNKIETRKTDKIKNDRLVSKKELNIIHNKCNQNTKISGFVIKNKQGNRPKLVTCNICGIKIHDYTLSVHMKKSHQSGTQNNKTNSIKCSICNNTFFSSMEYLKHIIYVNGVKTCKLGNKKHN